MPAETGRFLASAISTPCGTASGQCCAEGLDRLGDEIGLARRQRAGEGAGQREAVGLRRARRQFVAEIGEHHQAFEIVKAVLAPCR